MRGEFDCSSYNERECSIHNHAFYLGEQHQQSKVDELQLKLSEDSRILHNVIEIERKKNDELQKRVDAVKQLIQTYKDEEKELELKEWEQSTIYGRVAIELEQALKGGCDEAK